MSFFDKKEDVLEIVLTPHGRSLLSKGKLMPMYYSFLDDDVIYDVSSTGDTELNYEVKERILENTLSLKPQTNMSDLTVKHTELEPDLTNDVMKKNIYTLGTSNNMEEFSPAWNVKMLRNEIASSSATLSIENIPINIPQINVDIEYEMTISNINNVKQKRGIRSSPELPMSKIYDDGSFLKIDEDQILAQLLEENGFSNAERIEIEVYKFDDAAEEKLIPLKFMKRNKTIQNDLFTPEKLTKESPRIQDITPETVEYYFDVRVDKEIPKEIEEGVIADVYTSRVTDIEDCDV